jgi:predicted house-cleaning noncanonical NTP pyrophosphatase (MazG superfamily)
MAAEEVETALRHSYAFSLSTTPLLVLGTQLIVRSSSGVENIGLRGHLNSRVSSASLPDVSDAVHRVYDQSRASLGQEHQDAALGIIVQQYRPPLLHGHLSNERRISKSQTRWLVEIETPLAEHSHKTRYIKARKTTKGNLRGNLPCKNLEDVEKRLREVASWACKEEESRSHFEWCWDGNCLWLVQRDIELATSGSKPHSSSVRTRFSAAYPDLKVFTNAIDSESGWQKIESLRIFKQAGLEIAQLFVLEKPKVIKQLSLGNVSRGLRRDIEGICASPIVFRTEVTSQGDEPMFLSPRSETINNPDDAIDWLKVTSKRLMNEGAKATRICFIAHRYIAARSGAFSLSRPENPRVLIDSIWGLPDGLLCYSHDSFEVLTQDKKIRKLIRCKPHFLASEEDGKWVQKSCHAPWDWRSSLADEEIFEIARQTKEVAKAVGRPVEIMFFVGVDSSTGYPPILPWIHVLDLPEQQAEETEYYYSGSSMPITNETDLERLTTFSKSRVQAGKSYIALRPVPDLLRSKDFVNKVAAVAIEQRIPVQLEGSILSHIYYMLQKAGVRVRCASKQLRESRKRQKFGKLVRDLVPLTIESKGETARAAPVRKELLFYLLKVKALEESLELYWAEDGARSFEELADILEVIKAACAAMGRDFMDLEILADRKRNERGGFEKGMILIETENVPLITPYDEPSLMQGVSDGGSGRKTGKPMPSEVEYVASSRRPAVRSSKIEIPLIPPNPDLDGRHFEVRAGIDSHLVKITYTEKAVVIELSDVKSDVHPPNQLSFDFG